MTSLLPSTQTTAVVSLLLGPLIFVATLAPQFALVPAHAEATTYQIQTRTAARATQHLRSDTTLATPRVFSQSLTLSAYDLRDNQSGDLNARVRLRYATDLGLARELQQDPRFDARWNDLSLDLAYLQWQPFDALQMSAGRQWHYSPLGMTDFDGLSVAWTDTGGTTRPFVRLAAGRDVQRGLTPWDPGAWDVQGLPPNESAVTDDPWHWMAAASTGVDFADRRHRAEIASRHHRRPLAEGTGGATTHHLGATATTTPVDSLTLTTTASVHTMTTGLDRARLDAAYRVGQGVVSVGVDHRRPVFAPSSIFNLFGAQPSRATYATWRRPFTSIASAFELRAWNRTYFDDDASFFSAGDEQAIGGAVAGHHRLRLRIPVDYSWQISAQTLTGSSGGDQYLGTSRLRVPGPMDGLFLTGRTTLLWAVADHHRRPDGLAASASLGAEFDLADIGQLSLTLESRSGPRTPANTAAFALFELESWR